MEKEGAMRFFLRLTINSSRLFAGASSVPNPTWLRSLHRHGLGVGTYEAPAKGPCFYNSSGLSPSPGTERSRGYW